MTTDCETCSRLYLTYLFHFIDIYLMSMSHVHVKVDKTLLKKDKMLLPFVPLFKPP